MLTKDQSIVKSTNLAIYTLSFAKANVNRIKRSLFCKQSLVPVCCYIDNKTLARVGGAQINIFLFCCRHVRKSKRPGTTVPGRLIISDELSQFLQLVYTCLMVSFYFQ